MKNIINIVVAGGLLTWFSAYGAAASAGPDYAVVVSKSTQQESGWREVVETLQAKHKATVISYENDVVEVLPQLRSQFPRFVCFVARPEEANRKLVGQAHRLTRQLDDDPYPDCFWGILTGYDAAAALRIARQQEPLTIHKVASGTELAMDRVEEGISYCELTKNKMVKKEKGGEAVLMKGPDDTTKALVDTLNEYHADMFVTSGHATERDWMIGFRYKNGFFKHQDGQLYGIDTQGVRYPIHSTNPKVYLPVGNCLMGNIDQRDCMALSWMNSGGVDQMFGYTLPTWYGYMGWGVLDYFVEQPGRYTLTEAFFANNIALIQRLKTFFPEGLTQYAGDDGSLPKSIAVGDAAKAAGLNQNDGRGLVFDRDVVAFYGDPAWEARMVQGRTAWDQSLSENNGTWTFEIKPTQGADSFSPVNKNGSQRGGRPMIAFLPKRIQTAKIIEGADLEPVITDDFILVPNPIKCDPSRKYRVIFQAKDVE